MRREEESVEEQLLTLSPNEKDKLENLLKQIQPDEHKRKLVGSSLQAYMAQESLSFKNFSRENKLLLVSTLYRLGVQVSKDTVYPRTHYNPKTKKNALVIQDNYLFLQKLVLEHTGANNLVVDVIFNSEFPHLTDVKIDENFNKTKYLTIDQIDYDQKFADVHSVIIGVSGNKIKHNTFKVFSKQYLLDRAVEGLKKGMIWRGYDGIDAGILNHNRLEMLKKTAIRAFVKERYGGALELIRSIEVSEAKLLAL